MSSAECFSGPSSPQTEQETGIIALCAYEVQISQGSESSSERAFFVIVSELQSRDIIPVSTTINHQHAIIDLSTAFIVILL